VQHVGVAQDGYRYFVLDSFQVGALGCGIRRRTNAGCTDDAVALDSYLLSERLMSVILPVSLSPAELLCRTATRCGAVWCGDAAPQQQVVHKQDQALHHVPLLQFLLTPLGSRSQHLPWHA
jgi:hypothetical protein